ncbi:unnamed protein product [Caenorhabditis sp. 36 PRJEB53466]|nr:unnamed protein product [Caenorhabditis sp. 36 PRJEB53466]
MHFKVRLQDHCVRTRYFISFRMSRHYHSDVARNVSILGAKLKFPSGKIAQNRFLKASTSTFTSSVSTDFYEERYGMTIIGNINTFVDREVSDELVKQIGSLVVVQFSRDHDPVEAAKYVREARFDGVQLHSQPDVSKIHEAIRQQCPASTGFMIGLKVDSDDFTSEKISLKEALKTCEEYERTGFDFVEFSFEPQNESSVLEFAEQIRPVFKDTVVYMTMRYPTVRSMVEAVTSGATQGIGIGHPTIRTDLPKKILEGTVTTVIRYVSDNENKEPVPKARSFVKLDGARVKT